jgi:hypothetical protein
MGVAQASRASGPLINSISGRRCAPPLMLSVGQTASNVSIELNAVKK